MPARDRRIFRSLAGAVVGTAFAWTAFFLLLPGAGHEPVPAAGVPDRLAGAAALLPWPAALLLAMVLSVSVGRLATGAFDPLRDPEGRILRVTQRVLTNTVEQTAIFVPALLAASVLAEAERLPALPLAAGLFVAGRLLFWAGYLAGPLNRAAGMVVTVNVNAGLLAYCLWRLAVAGPAGPG
jgi:uncharacterized MAPEG superfamily protein